MAALLGNQEGLSLGASGTKSHFFLQQAHGVGAGLG